MASGTRRDWFSLHAAVLLFGGSGLFARLVDWPATSLVLGRVTFAALALALWHVVSHRARLRQGRGQSQGQTTADAVIRTSPRIPLALGVLLAAHWVAFFHAIQISSVAVGVAAFTTFPVFAALLEPLLPGQRLDRTALLASLVCLVGVVLVVVTPSDTATPTLAVSSSVARWSFDAAALQGAMWGVFSGASFAVLSLANRTLVNRHGAVRLSLFETTGAALTLVPVVWLTADMGGLVQPTPRDLGLVVLLGVVFTAGAHGLFIFGLRGISAARAAVITSLEPVYGITLAAALLGERPYPTTLIGAGLILTAAFQVSRPRIASPDQ